MKINRRYIERASDYFFIGMIILGCQNDQIGFVVLMVSLLFYMLLERLDQRLRSILAVKDFISTRCE